MKLHYTLLGHGPRILLAFHGVGQTGRACYEPVGRLLGQHYTVYAFDLPHHGQSPGVGGTDHFADADVLTKVLWKKYLQEFLEEENIARFSVAGFSLGGRFALATAEAFPERLDRLILMAPDGVFDHFMFRLATRFYPARRLYRQLSHDPRPLFAAATLAHRARLLPERLVGFVRYSMGTPAQRQMIYRSWISLRQFSFAIPKLCKMLQSYHAEIWLFVGKYDPVIPPARMKLLADQLPPEHFVILESSHGGLVEKVARWAVARASRPCESKESDRSAL